MDNKCQFKIGSILSLKDNEIIKCPIDFLRSYSYPQLFLIVRVDKERGLVKLKPIENKFENQLLLLWENWEPILFYTLSIEQIRDKFYYVGNINMIIEIVKAVLKKQKQLKLNKQRKRFLGIF